MNPRTLTPEQAHAIVQAQHAIEWAQITSSMEINRMNNSRKKLDYIDLHPEPVQQDEPVGWLIWLGAAVALVGLCAALALGFAAGRGLLGLMGWVS